MTRLLGAAVALTLAAPPLSGQVASTHRPAKQAPYRLRTHRRHHHRERADRTARRRARRTRGALSPVVLREWTHVAVCEEGGWIGRSGPAFPDSLGISAANWWSHGGGVDESPAAQIAVARRIEGTSFVPDQEGCAAW